MGSLYNLNLREGVDFQVKRGHWLAEKLGVNCIAFGKTLYCRKLIDSVPRHEFLHLAQFKKHGIVRVIFHYLFHVTMNYFRLKNLSKAFREVPFEIEATSYEKASATSGMDEISSNNNLVPGDQSNATPAIKGLPWIGVATAIRRRGFYSVCEEALRGHGSPVVIRVLGRNYVLIDQPEQAQRVLQDRARNYRRTRYYEVMRCAFGAGIVTTDGPQWAQRRRIIQRGFMRARIPAFIPVVKRSLERTLDRWESIADGRCIDLWPEIVELTMRINLQALCGDGNGLDIQRIVRHIEGVHSHVQWLFLFPWIRLAPSSDFRNALQKLDGVACGILEAARSMTSSGLLSGMLDSANGLSDRQLRDEIILFLAAGHETLASALAWSIYLLARHPEIQDRLASEPDVDASSFISGDSSFCRMVLKESLRLYPPIPSVSRTNLKTDELGGRRLEPESYVNVIINSLHRNAESWDDPDTFRPERFRKEEVERRHRYAYLPFGAGQHKCIGFRFAIREGETILAGIAKRFRIEPARQEPIKPYVLMTQRPLGGLPLKVTRRK